MRALPVDFVRRGSPVGWMGWSITVLALMFTCVQLWRITELKTRLAMASDRAYERAASAVSSPAVKPPGAPSARGIAELESDRAWNQMKSFQLATALRAVESIRVPGSRVVSLSIDTHAAAVDLEIELADLSQLQACVEQLDHAWPQAGWHVTVAQEKYAGGRALARVATSINRRP